MRTQARDAEFKSFYLAEASRLRHFALLLTADSEQAADLTQEALLRAYRHWHRIRRENPGPYVRRIVVNLHRNKIRRAMVERKHQPDPPRDTPEKGPEVDEALRVAEALRALSPMRRATVVLRYYEDLPDAQIAHVLDRPIGTVKSDLHRALQQLRQLLGEAVKENS
jgi:RNA polymerase sigma-70 factor (sigma-E family)